MPLYLYIMLFSLSYPLVQSFEQRLQYYKKWKALFLAIAISATAFIIWDELFTTWGVWGFNPDYLLGIYLGHLPLEEILFFIIVPFSSVFIYECVRYFLPKLKNWKGASKIVYVTGALLIILAVIFRENLYTGVTFSVTGLFLLMHGFLNKSYLPDFIISYVIHLIPFLLVNGVLTGSFIASPIVWYDNTEIIGIRIGTIPVEDSIYGLLLFLLTVTFYEYFKIKFNIKHI
jgi:lycopene cyclase domain-containing protein